MLIRNFVLAAVVAVFASTLLGASNLKPGEGYISVPGGKVWYRIVGNGKGTPLMVLHGGPGVPSYYLKPLAALGNDRPVIFYDQLGCGHSDHVNDTTLWNMDRFIAELKCIRDSLDLKEVYVLGHSWGSMLALDYLLTKPSGVKGCILASPPISAASWMKDATDLLATLPDSVQQIIRETDSTQAFDSQQYQDAVGVFYQQFLARKLPWSADIDTSFAQMNQGLYVYMNGVSEFNLNGTLQDYDRTARLKEIKIPVLYTAGEFDEARPATVKKYQQRTPGAEISILPGCGHLTMQDDPDGYVKVVRAFLNRSDKK